MFSQQCVPAGYVFGLLYAVCFGDDCQSIFASIVYVTLCSSTRCLDCTLPLLSVQRAVADTEGLRRRLMNA